MDNLKQTPRIKFIAYLQVIGIILVVFGHSLHESPTPYTELLVYEMLYSFHMPLFIFVSGFLMYMTSFACGREAPAIRNFFLKKVKRLLLPFFILSTITFIPRSLLSGFADDSISLTFTSYIRSFINTNEMVIPFFWFIETSFTLLIFTFVIIVICRKINLSDNVPMLMLLICFILFPFFQISSPSIFSLDNTVRLCPYFILGCLYCKYESVIDKYIPWTNPLFFVVVCSLWAILYFTFKGTSLMVLCSTAGIMMCVSVAQIFVKYGINCLEHLVGTNYIIFLLSWYFNVASQQMLHSFTDFHWFIYTVISLITGIYVPWLIYRYLESSADKKWVKITALLLGQNLRKQSNFQHRRFAII